MDINNITRKQKEKLYIEKMTKLQLHWKNPIDDDWDFSDWTDEQLNKRLKDTIGQFKFEMFFSKKYLIREYKYQITSIIKKLKSLQVKHYQST